MADDIEVADIRDAALKGIGAFLEEEGHAVMVGMTQLKYGLVYIDGVGPKFVIEVHQEMPNHA